VHPDTILAVLANPAVESALAQAKANLASAEAERASLRAQLASEMLTLEGDLATAQAEAATAGEKERAERSLLDSHIVSSLEYAGSRAKAFEYTRLVELAKLRIAAFRRSVTSQDRAAASRVAALRAVLGDSRQAVDALSVTAEMDGVVQDVAIHPGQTLPLGGGVARVASVKALKVVLEVPASEAGEVEVGQSVALELSTEVAQDLRGRVVRVSPTVSNNGVEVDVMPVGVMPPDVRPNLAVTGDVHIAKISDAVYVQRPAFAGPNSAMTLYRLVDNGRAAVPVRVSFGAASDRYIQIASGLKSGDRVIISDTGSFAGDRRITLR
jgi:multidrug efflux pump subunit AcrA (membrane-fusion protein)